MNINAWRLMNARSAERHAREWAERLEKATCPFHRHNCRTYVAYFIAEAKRYRQLLG